jgi:predicted dinucleotide-binding enzyme
MPARLPISSALKRPLSHTVTLRLERSSSSPCRMNMRRRRGRLRECARRQVIIDITNPVAPGLSDLVTPPRQFWGAGERWAFPPMRVVKAFNIIFGLVLAKGGRYDALIAAADANAKARVSSLLESLSLPARDIGGLHMPGHSPQWM